MKRFAPLAIAASLFLSSCAVDTADFRVGPPPLCDTTSRGLLILMAQAVPDAEQIPCFQQIPEGWTMKGSAVGTGYAVLRLEGVGVDEVSVRLTPSCDPSGEPSEGNDAQQSDVAIFVDTSTTSEVRQFVFTGGCVVVTAPARLAASEMTRQVSLVSRAHLREVSGLKL